MRLVGLWPSRVRERREGRCRRRGEIGGTRRTRESGGADAAAEARWRVRCEREKLRGRCDGGADGARSLQVPGAGADSGQLAAPLDGSGAPFVASGPMAATSLTPATSPRHWTGQRAPHRFRAHGTGVADSDRLAAPLDEDNAPVTVVIGPTAPASQAPATSQHHWMRATCQAPSSAQRRRWRGLRPARNATGRRTTSQQDRTKATRPLLPLADSAPVTASVPASAPATRDPTSSQHHRRPVVRPVIASGPMAAMCGPEPVRNTAGHER